jgi:phosphate transport system substrate-binding protein
MMRRAVDISLSARKLKEAERQEGLVEVAIGTTPFVIAVAKENASNSITAAELADIYSGKLQAWPDGSLLRLVLRPEGDTDTTLLRSMSPEMNAAMDIAHKRPGLILGVTDQDSADRIEKQPGSIGTSTLAQILTEKRNLKALAINGVIPSPETIANKEYPLSKTYFFITEKEPSSSVKEFLRFVQSDSGQSLLFQYGYQIQP